MSEIGSGGLKELVKRPTIADTFLGPIKKKIYDFVETRVKPSMLRPGEESGRRYLYVDPRIGREKLK